MGLSYDVTGTIVNPAGSDYVFVPPGPTPPPLPVLNPEPAQLGGGGQATWGQTIPVSAGTRAITGAVIWVSDPRRSEGAATENPPPAAGMSEQEYLNVLIAAWGLNSIGVGELLGYYSANGNNATAAGNAFINAHQNDRWLGGGGPYVNPYKLPPRSTGSSTPVLPVPVDPGFIRIDCAIAFGYSTRPADERVPITLVRLWADGNLIYGPLEEIGTPADPDMEVRFYEGSPDQEPDPTIKAAEGDDTPGFRDMIYCVIKNLKLDEKKPTVPVFRAEMSDKGTASSPTATAFDTNNEVAFNGGFFVDRDLGLYFAFSQTTVNPAFLHEYDLRTDTELGFVEIAPLSTSHIFVDSPSFWSAYDKTNKIVHFQHGNAIGNRMPIATARTDTGFVIGDFGVEDTSLTSDENGATESSYGDIMKFTSMGVEAQDLVVAGGSGNHVTFMRYKHATKPVLSNAGQNQTLDFGGPVDPADFHLGFDLTFTYTDDINSFLIYPVLDRPELKNAWAVEKKTFQDGIVLVGTGSLINAISVNVQNNGQDPLLGADAAPTTTLVADQNEPVFDCGMPIDLMFLDQRTGAVMVVCKQSGAWYLTRLVPQWVSLPNGSIAIGSFHPNYQLIPIDDFNTSAFRAAMKWSNFSEGKFGYPVGSHFVVYDLQSARKQYDEVTAVLVSDDYYFNWGNGTVVASQGVDDKVTRHFLFGNVTVEGIALVDFMRWCALKLGYQESEIEDDGIPDTIIGNIMDSPTPVRQLMDIMAQVFDFDIVEVGTSIKFLRKDRGSAATSVATMAREDLSPLAEGEDNNAIKTTVAAPDEVPADVKISYIDASMDYMPNAQIYRRVRFPFETVKTKRLSEFQVPIVMTPNDALSRAGRLVYANFANSIVYEWRAPQKFLATEPSDIVTLYDKNLNPLLVKVTQVTCNADWSLSFGGINWSFKDLRSESVLLPDELPRGYKPPIIHGPSDSAMLAFDTTLIDAVQNVAGVIVVYHAIGSLGQSWWEGGREFRQLDAETEVDLGNNRTATSYATVGEALPACNAAGTTFQTDVDTVLTVRGRAFVATALATVTTDEFLAGANAALVGRSGRWELIFFRDVTAVSDTECQISHITRGRRGTDPFCDLHSAGDLFVPIKNSHLRMDQLQATDIGKVDRYSVRGLNTTGPRQSETISPLKGNSHKPWAPRFVTLTSGATVNAVGAPDYTNTCGGGTVLIPTGVDRRDFITVTMNHTPASDPLATIDHLVNGDDSNGTTGSASFDSGWTDLVLQFDFRPSGFKQRITELQWVQNNNVGQGNYDFEGSDDGVTWTSIRTNFDLVSGSSFNITTFTNLNYYYFYRLVQVSGSTSNSPWLKEVYFKIAADVDPDDVVIDWLRRDRLSPAPLFVEDDQPMTEAIEEYEVDIISAGSVVRTFSALTNPRAVYTATMQTADGFTPQVDSVTLRVYQMSALVGRGLTYEQTLEVP
jgi:hypothetical protein